MNSLSFYLLPIVLLVGFTGNGTVLLDDVSNVNDSVKITEVVET